MAQTTRAAEAFERLVGIVRYLRGPNGCPWDRAQTLQTLRPFVLEETYEVLEALDKDDRVALREELGDFVFEAVLLAQVCEEAGEFSIADSLESISNKLVRRHVHVFGEPDGSAPRPADGATMTPDEVIHLWESVKARETTDAGKPKTALGGVPRTLPALLRAHEISTRAAAVGFDWERGGEDRRGSGLTAGGGRLWRSGRPGTGRRGDGRLAVRDGEPVSQTRHRARVGAARSERQVHTPLQCDGGQPPGGRQAAHELHSGRNGDRLGPRQTGGAGCATTGPSC